MKVCNSKNFSCILVAASLLFTSLFFSCSNGSSDSGSSGSTPPAANPAGGNGGGGSGGGGGGGGGSGSGGGGTPPAPTTLNSITNPITLTVTIPADTEYVEIRRRKVTASHQTVTGEGVVVVGVLNFTSTDEGYGTERTKSFTDLFGVQNGSCYEYKIFTRLTGQTNGTESSASYHTATYNGLTPPSFGTGDAYPEIKYTNGTTQKLNLNNVNNVNIVYHNSEELQTNYWKLNLTYNWSIQRFFDNNPSNAEWIIPDSVKSTAATGDNELTDVSLELKFNNDNNCDFVRVIHLDTASIDGSKIDKKILLNTPEIGVLVQYTSTNQFERKVHIKLKYPQNNPKIRDIYIQRRIHSEDEWGRPTGYLDNRNTNYSVGYLNEADIHSCIDEYGFIKFTDRYGFSQVANRYDYRAIIRTGDNYEEKELALGTTATAEILGGLNRPLIQTNSLAFTWTSASQTLQLSPSYNLTSVVPDLGSSPTFDILITYKKQGDGSKVFTPIFRYTPTNQIETIQIPNTFGNNYTLNAVACNLAVKTQGNQIRQFIKQNITTLPSGIEQLTYPAN